MVVKKGTKKRVMKKSKSSRKNRTRRVKKGGNLSQVFVDPGDCVKKGMGLTGSYRFIRQKSSGFGLPTVIVEDVKTGEQFNGGPMRDWNKCKFKGRMGGKKGRRTKKRSRKH